MTEYIEKSMSKSERLDSAAKDILMKTESERDGVNRQVLRHGEWIAEARKSMKARLFSNPIFALLLIITILFAGSVYLFEHMEIVDETVYAMKVIVTSMFAITVGFLLSVWWSSTARFDDKIKEAERIDVEYRELLMSFSDSLFDIINALNTLAEKPPRAFVIATEFLLNEYIHLLQSRLQRYGDHIAGLGFDATGFLDEKMHIFEGIRERASLSIRGMPREVGDLFVENLNLDIKNLSDSAAQRQNRLQMKLKELTEDPSVKAKKVIPTET